MHFPKVVPCAESKQSPVTTSTNDLYNFMKKQGYSEEQIKSAIRNTHLLDAINRLKEILCEPEEIVSILQKDGWKKEEIETAIKSQAS